MQKQTMFNRVWNHFIVRGNPRSVDPDLANECLYRGPNGAKCAAGLFISDKRYDPEIEKAPISDHEMKVYLSRGAAKQVVFLRELQEAHDNINGSHEPKKAMEEFESSLRKLAKEHNLTLPTAKPKKRKDA